MELTNYSINDLKYLLHAVLNDKYEAFGKFGKVDFNSKRYGAMLQFEIDIEQAIKDKEFERDQTTLPPLSN